MLELGSDIIDAVLSLLQEALLTQLTLTHSMV